MRDDAGSITFELDDGLTGGSIVTVLVRTPAGEVRIMGELLELGARVWLTSAHIDGAGPNTLGRSGLTALARAFAEAFDVDEIVVEGETRTTGARPGHRPLAFRWGRPR